MGRKLNTFPGVRGSAMVKVVDGEVAETGSGQPEIDAYGLKEVESVSISSHTLAGCYPGAKPLWITLYCYARSKRLLGGLGSDPRRRAEGDAVGRPAR